MKLKKFCRKLMISGLLFASIGFSASASAATISLLPSAGVNLGNISVGDTFSLDLVATGLTASMTGGATSGTFDSTLFSLDSIVFASVYNVPLSNTIGAGTYTAAAGAFFTVPAFPDQTFATLTFTALAAGIGTIDFLENIGLGGFVYGDNTRIAGVGAAALTGAQSITVNAVPLPAAVWLFGSALIGLVGMSRRKSSKL